MEEIRRQRLYQLAEQDEIYKTWEYSYQECAEKFNKVAKWFPKHIRSIIYSYADFGRMMLQRMTNLACKYMEFPDERQ